MPMLAPRGPLTRVLAATALAAAASAVRAEEPAAAADPPATLSEAFAAGRALLDVRLRYEGVDTAGSPTDADALTVRTRLGYRTGRWRGFAALVELENVTAIGDERFNSTDNGRTRFPVVADPPDTELNQAFLEYGITRGQLELTATAGRRRLKVADDRFIGNVGWRQNEQTFDAVTVEGTYRRGEFIAGHLSNANRVFGEHHSNPLRADTDLDGWFVELAHAWPSVRVALFGHWLEFVDTPAVSHRNLGVRVTGEHAFREDLVLRYEASYADQADYATAPSSVDAEYLRGVVRLATKRVTPGLGYEKLGGDGTYGFSTPLATLHAFNGWADLFLATPATGLVDTWLEVGGTVEKVRWLLVVHDFSADAGGADYGTEVDVRFVRPFGERLSGLIKLADYDADAFGRDTTKVWLALVLKL